MTFAIPSLRDVVYGLFGAWRLAHLDPAGMTYFERTVDGFWKSFFAAVLIAPAYILVIALDAIRNPPEADMARVVLVHTLAYVLNWVVFPVLAHGICTAIDRASAFIDLIVALNWTKVIQTAAYIPIVLITTSDLLPGALAALINAVVYSLLLAYQWFVTRTALGVGAAAAVGLVALDLFIGLMIDGFAIGMVR
ncbi:MAG: hypothetical protein D6826_10470 [Alphaproteobacteria bacterium]|nr:MAG: hypothetical protein D6826_10470 [Alphaproteobacteria bacterium]